MKGCDTSLDFGQGALVEDMVGSVLLPAVAQRGVTDTPSVEAAPARHCIGPEAVEQRPLASGEVHSIQSVVGVIH